MSKIDFVKVFVSGPLNGISIPCKLPMANEKLAREYLTYCNEHSTKPVSSLVGSGSTFIIENAVIVGL